MTKCKAKTAHGEDCKYEATIHGFCMMHFTSNRNKQKGNRRNGK